MSNISMGSHKVMSINVDFNVMNIDKYNSIVYEMKKYKCGYKYIGYSAIRYNYNIGFKLDGDLTNESLIRAINMR